jgi:pimeloyl-ACP methyl ester carboxylesterase
LRRAGGPFRLRGRIDSPIPYANEFKRLMPGAELEIIPRCGHLPQAEKPEEFCDIVMRFAGKG